MNRAIQSVRAEFHRWVFCTDGNWRMWVMIAFWLAVFVAIA